MSRNLTISHFINLQVRAIIRKIKECLDNYKKFKYEQFIIKVIILTNNPLLSHILSSSYLTNYL